MEYGKQIQVQLHTLYTYMRIWEHVRLIFMLSGQVKYIRIDFHYTIKQMHNLKLIEIKLKILGPCPRG